MIDVNKLLDNAMKSCGYNTDTQLAKHLKVRHSAVSNWRNGRNQPDVVSAAELARVTGEKLQAVIATIEESRAKSAKAKEVWRKIASAAAICLAIYTAIKPQHGAAIAGMIGFLHIPDTVGIAHI